MTPANYWKLGLFIVGCLTIALGTLAFLGTKQLRREVEVVHFYFNEPVDGLKTGSEVRLRGIPIGSVTAVGLAEDRMHVHAEAQIDVATLERLGLREVDVDDPPEFMREALKKSGLRAFLEQNILTGISLINCDYFESLKGQFPEYPFEIPIRTLPTAPSAFKGIMADLEATLRWLRTELPTTVEGLQGLITQLERSLEGSDLATLSQEIQSTLRELREQSSQLTSSMENALDGGKTFFERLSDERGPFETFLQTYSELGEELRGEVRGLELAKTQQSLERTLLSIGRTSDGIGDLSDEFRDDLEQLGRALESMQRLAEMLERDPSALLRGRDRARSPIERNQP